MARDYVCEIDACGKSFSTSSHLRRHERTHRNARPYVCEHCNKAFARKEVWQRHEALHVDPVATNPRVRPVTMLTPSTPGSPARQGGPSVVETPTHPHTVIEDSSMMMFGATPEPDAPVAPSSSQLLATGSVHTPSEPPLDVRHLLGQSPELLFDAQVYGWLEHILVSQSGGGVPTRSPPTYFPPAVFEPSPEQALSPQLTPERQDALLTLVQTMSLAMGSAALRCDGPTLASYFLSGWETVVTSCPIIHVPTFDIDAVPPVFLLSIAACGAARSAVEADRFCAKQLQPIIRAIAVAASLDNPATRLAVFQAFLFSAVAGEHLDDEEQHHALGMISHVMSLMRRFGFLFISGSGNTADGDRDADWRSWIETETKRRTLWLCWMLDIRSVTLGHHFGSRARSPFRMTIELPCRHDCWAARNSYCWAARLHTPETIPSALHRTLTANWSREWFADDQLHFARLVIVHALAALAWDLTHRDLISPPELSNQGTSQIATSLVAGMQSLGYHPSINGNVAANCANAPLAVEAFDIATAASLDIFAPLVALEIFCGVSSVGMNRAVKTSDRLDANRKVRSWSTTPQGSEAVLVATQFLKHSIECLEWGRASISHSWTVYFAFLVLWANRCSRRHQLGPVPRETDESESVSDLVKPALDHLSQVSAYAKAGNSGAYDGAGLRQLGRVAMDIMSQAPADLVKGHLRVVKQLVEMRCD